MDKDTAFEIMGEIFVGVNKVIWEEEAEFDTEYVEDGWEWARECQEIEAKAMNANNEFSDVMFSIVKNNILYNRNFLQIIFGATEFHEEYVTLFDNGQLIVMNDSDYTMLDTVVESAEEAVALVVPIFKSIVEEYNNKGKYFYGD